MRKTHPQHKSAQILAQVLYAHEPKLTNRRPSARDRDQATNSCADAIVMLPCKGGWILKRLTYGYMALISFIAANACFAQKPIAPRPVQAIPAPVFYSGAGVVAPELIPRQWTFEETPGCVKVSGTTVFSATVDEYGRTGLVSILKSAEPGLDWEARSILASDRFKPGTHNGSPADIAVEVEVGIHGCIYGKKKSGSWQNIVSLLSPPEQSVTIRQQPGQSEILKQPNLANGNTALRFNAEPASVPKLLKKVLPQYPTDAREANITGECLVRVTVDEKGIPHDPQLVRGIEPSLDQEAIETVMQYRFSPAIRVKDSRPDSVTLNLLVEFKLD